MIGPIKHQDFDGIYFKGEVSTNENSQIFCLDGVGTAPKLVHKLSC